MTVTLFLLLLYSVLQIGLGLWIGRRVRRGDDFFVAGRGLSAGLIFSTFLAANIGAGSTVGATALGYADGWSAWWRNGSAGLGSLALAFWIGPRIWREARTHGDFTVGDFLQRHYGPSMRRAVAALIWLGYVVDPRWSVDRHCGRAAGRRRVAAVRRIPCRGSRRSHLFRRRRTALFCVGESLFSCCSSSRDSRSRFPPPCKELADGARQPHMEELGSSVTMRCSAGVTSLSWLPPSSCRRVFCRRLLALVMRER